MSANELRNFVNGEYVSARAGMGVAKAAANDLKRVHLDYGG